MMRRSDPINLEKDFAGNNQLETQVSSDEDDEISVRTPSDRAGDDDLTSSKRSTQDLKTL